MAEDNDDRRPLAAEAVVRERRQGGMMPPLVVAAIVITGLYFARPVLEPFALAILLSLLLAPGARWLRHRGLGRVAAVFLTVLFAFIVIVGLGAAVGEEAISLVQHLPQYEQNIAAKIRSLSGAVPGAGIIDRATHVFHDLSSELTLSTEGLGGGPAPVDARTPIPVVIHDSDTPPFLLLRTIVGPLLSPLSSGGLVFLFVVLILLKREDLRDRVLRLAGARDLHRTTSAMNEAAERVSHYLLMQLGAGVCFGLPVGIGLFVIGIPNAPLWGILGVVLRFIPYLGGALSAIFPVVLAIAVAPGWDLFLWTLALFVAVEMLVGNVLEPLVYGRSTGLSAVAVIVASVFWTWLWGAIGLLLATPLTVCLVVIGRYVPNLQFLDILLGNQPVLSSEESLYQRLLSHDPEEATEQAEAFAREKSIEAFFDEVALPALIMAQHDSDRGILAAHRRAVLAEAFAAVLDNLAEDGLMTDEPASAEGPTIVCLAVRNELDLAAAWILRHLLRLRGHRAVVFSPDAVSTFNLNRLPLDGVAAVCLSQLGAPSDSRARYLVRRLRRRIRRATIIVAHWGADSPSFSIDAAMVTTAADSVVTRLGAAITEIERVLGGNPPAAISEEASRQTA
ncbi:MAG TPA: AI-2E family transporter [Stellaceae bacterium]|jgi:predicted PurR-regulated permease PerM|nr:AI-2E family transporter [Stellaceae bacterium]